MEPQTFRRGISYFGLEILRPSRRLRADEFTATVR
jgi:hypothetical protein